MEFKFNLNDIFTEPIVEVNNTLIPPGFKGDKRALWDTQSKVSQLVNAIGEASAGAQGLTKPITTSDRLRNSEHRLYLLIDHAANNGKGAVTGMLKTGEKGLYVFDREGQHYQVAPPCVLDFYIHESRQRSGFGKRLFEHMLQKEQIEPVKMAIDRPSEKFLGFLNKHYGLNTPVKQMNNYVVFDGFFPKPAESSRRVDSDQSRSPGKKQSANGLQHGYHLSAHGRYGAPRPLCSMGQIIHNDSPVLRSGSEPTGVRSEPITNVHAQHNLNYSNQPHLWQSTQSTPNMQYGYQPNQQPYIQTEPNNQILCQNNALISSTNNPGQPYSEQLPQQNPVQISQNQNQIGLNNDQKQGWGNSIGQGDAGLYYQGQNVSNHSQALYSNGQNLVDAMPVQAENQYQVQGDQNPVVDQCQVENNHYQAAPQYVTNQDQNRDYYQQNQVYQLLSINQNQHTIQSGSINPQPNQNTYYYQPPVSGEVNQQENMPRIQPSADSRSKPIKEPLIPQMFDGSVSKKAPQMVQSMPNQRLDGQINNNQRVLVQSSPSAPVGYQHQQQRDMNYVPQQNRRVGDQSGAPNDQTATQSQAGDQAMDQNQNNYQQVAQNQTAVTQNQVEHNSNGARSQHGDQISAQNQPQVNTQQCQNIVAYQRNDLALKKTNGIQIQYGVQIPAQNQPFAPYHNNQQPQNTAASQPNHLAPQPNQLHQSPCASIMDPSVNTQQVASSPQIPTASDWSQQRNMGERANYVEQRTLGHVQGLQQNLTSGDGTVAGQNHCLQKRFLTEENDVDITKGYPPQQDEITASNGASKADRPQSLQIETDEDHLPDRNNEEIPNKETLDGNEEEEENNDIENDYLKDVEEQILKLDVAPTEGSRSPGLEAAGLATPRTSTPGMTDHGYYDLKFYHNKLW